MFWHVSVHQSIHLSVCPHGGGGGTLRYLPAVQGTNPLCPRYLPPLPSKVPTPSPIQGTYPPRPRYLPPPSKVPIPLSKVPTPRPRYLPPTPVQGTYPPHPRYLSPHPRYLNPPLLKVPIPPIQGTYPPQDKGDWRGYPRPGQGTPSLPLHLALPPAKKGVPLPPPPPAPTQDRCTSLSPSPPLFPLPLPLPVQDRGTPPSPPSPHRTGSDGCAARAVCLLRLRRRTFFWNRSFGLCRHESNWKYLWLACG